MAKMNKRDYEKQQRERRKQRGLREAESKIRSKRAARNYERRR